MNQYAPNDVSDDLETVLSKKNSLNIALVAATCEVSSLLNEAKQHTEQDINVLGVLDSIDVSVNQLQDSDDFLSEGQPFYNHFNGSDKFKKDIAVEAPPENGDEWLKTNGNGEVGLDEVNTFDSVDNFDAFIEETEVDFLVFSEAHNYSDTIYEYLKKKEQNGLKVLPFAEFFRAIANKEPLVNFSEHSFLYDFEFPETTVSQKWWRRLMDLGASSTGIVILAPIWLVIAAAIKLTSDGPVIYKQTRVGKDGNEFTLYKFRTMKENAEDEGPQWSSKDDDRVTALGKILRTTRLDETPQFLNILKGDMRLIGPRPERPEFVETLRQQVPFFDHRHRVLPGLTGWAQIHYGYGSSVEDAMIKLQYDLYGIRHRSIPMDLKILWKTFLVVTGIEEFERDDDE